MSRYRALAVIAIHNERRRQVDAEGWTTEHDDEHATGELRLAANAYLRYADDPTAALTGAVPEHWPWSADWWKPSTVERCLVKAGALCLAEEDRLERTGFFLNRQIALYSIADLRRRAIKRLAMIYRAEAEAWAAAATALAHA